MSPFAPLLTEQSNYILINQDRAFRPHWGFGVLFCTRMDQSGMRGGDFCWWSQQPSGLESALNLSTQDSVSVAGAKTQKASCQSRADQDVAVEQTGAELSAQAGALPKNFLSVTTDYSFLFHHTWIGESCWHWISTYDHWLTILRSFIYVINAELSYIDIDVVIEIYNIDILYISI